MVCQNCGTQLPDGTPSCPTCGAQMLAQQPYMDPNQAFAQPNPNDALFNQAPYNAAPAAPAKSNKTGMIIGIVAAVVAIILIAFFAIKLLGGSEYDGKYKLTKCTVYGFEYTIEEMEEMSGESFDMSLVVKGSKCTLDAEAMGYDEASCKIEIKDDTVTLIEGDEELVGTYDADAKTITLNAAGVDMVFELQD